VEDLKWYEPKYSVYALLDYAECIVRGVYEEDENAYAFMVGSMQERIYGSFKFKVG